MCTHDQSWARDRINRIAATLGIAPTPTLPSEPLPSDKPSFVYKTFPTGNGTLEVTFLIWSPMTAPYKSSLNFDRPGANGDTSFPYTRSTLNGQLKTGSASDNWSGLMNDCLSDAVVYAGRNGDSIRFAIRDAVCAFLGGRSDGDRGTVCDLHQADLDQPVAIVTESLGSKFAFDAIRAIWDSNSDNRQMLQRRLAAISAIYFIANQIPLLDLASYSSSPIDVHRRAASSLEGFLELRNVRNTPPVVIVAFSDPNDLLTYRLLPQVLGVQKDGATLINVIVSNDYTYAGYVERPDFAHCGYAWNRNVIGLIANGYHPGEPVPLSPSLSSNQCF
jgi:hypothetical protein